MDITNAEVMGGWHPRKKLAQQDTASGCLSLFVGESLGGNDPPPQVCTDKKGSLRSQKKGRARRGRENLGANAVGWQSIPLHSGLTCYAMILIMDLYNLR